MKLLRRLLRLVGRYGDRAKLGFVGRNALREDAGEYFSVLRGQIEFGNLSHFGFAFRPQTNL